MTFDIRSEMRSLLADAAMAADPTDRATLEKLIDQYDQPLRIAIAGMIKAGKSTLMNALVGQRIAATDAGECTRIVTSYQRGQRYRVTAIDRNGETYELRFDRGETLEIHLDGRAEGDIEQIQVDWPSERLAGRRLIDTPGLGSISENVSQRSIHFLTTESEFPTDAVVYLMRHRHPANLDFLEAFHGGFAASGGMSAIGVLSRADELGGGRIDSLETAERVAQHIAADPRVTRLCQRVFPVAGLLAETAATLRQDEYASLAALTTMTDDDRANALLGVDRFLTSSAVPLDPEIRQRLLERFGMYGLRLGTSLVADRSQSSAEQLSNELTAHSGIRAIEREIRARFDARRSVLRVRAAMAVLSAMPIIDDPGVAARFERIASNAHEVYELDLLDRLRGRTVTGLSDERKWELQRTLGVDGPAPARRLALDESAGTDTVLEAASEQLDGWRRTAEHPLTSPELAHLSRMAARSLEALIERSGQPSA